MLDTKQFYDDLSSYYHLIFEDWDASMARQGDALVELIEAELERLPAGDVRVLDAVCGIGTQTLPLAARGFQLFARDLSPVAVARLRREAEDRQLFVDAAVADMRQVASSVSGAFDVVLAFDNSARTFSTTTISVLPFNSSRTCSVRVACSSAPSVITTRCNAASLRRTYMAGASIVERRFN